MHFKEHSIKVMFPDEFNQILNYDRKERKETTQHGMQNVIITIKDRIDDFRNDLMYVAVAVNNKYFEEKRKHRCDTHDMIRYKPLEIKGISFEDVVGLDEVKEEIARRVIMPFKHPEIFSKYGLGIGGGIMLYGPPGNGKTMIARAVASELELPFYTISSSDILGPFVGETEKAIRELFRNISDNPAAILFVDEAEALFPLRGNPYSPWESSMTNEFLVAMDGLKKTDNKILFIGATNNLDLVDPAILRPGRFDTLMQVGMPDAEGRMKIFQKNLENVPHEDTIDYDSLVRWTEDMSAAEITELCNTAKAVRALNECENADDSKEILMKDFIRAIEIIMARKKDQAIELKGENKKSNKHDDAESGNETYIANPNLVIQGYA